MPPSEQSLWYSGLKESSWTLNTNPAYCWGQIIIMLWFYFITAVVMCMCVSTDTKLTENIWSWIDETGLIVSRNCFCKIKSTLKLTPTQYPWPCDSSVVDVGVSSQILHPRREPISELPTQFKIPEHPTYPPALPHRFLCAVSLIRLWAHQEPCLGGQAWNTWAAVWRKVGGSQAWRVNIIPGLALQLSSQWWPSAKLHEPSIP